MEVHLSARRHGVNEEASRHAATHYMIAYTLDDDRPARELRLGFDSRGRVLETVVLLLDDGTELVIHAMKARPATSTCCHDREETPMTNENAPRTASGEPVTDELVQALADEAESGYDPEPLRRKGGRRPIGSAAARVFPVRLDPELEEALRQRAVADRSNTSEVIRDALRAWLQSA